MNHNISSNWIVGQRYSNKELDVYPRRAIGTGPRSGLTNQFFFPGEYLEYICAGHNQGFRISVHNPGEVPRTSDQYFRVSWNQEVTATVVPTMIETAESLRNYPPDIRQCFFNQERSLSFFKTYTQKNCELECLTNFTLNRCSCVKFSMPRHLDTKICNRLDIECYNQAENDFMGADLELRLSNSMDKPELCNCLPSCTSISYGTDIFQNSHDYQIYLYERYYLADRSHRTDFSLLNIYFKEMQFTTITRSELYGVIDFISSCGGLMGKFNLTRQNKNRVKQ